MKSPEIHLMKVCYSRFFVVILQALIIFFAGVILIRRYYG